MTDTINEGPLNVNNQSCEPYGKFRIAKDALTEIAYACQDREFSQEVDKLQEQGGDQWIQVHPLAATRLGRTLHRLQQGHPRRPRRPQAARHRLREQQEAGDQAQKLLPTSYSHSRGFHPQDPHRLRHHQHHHRNRHCRPKPPLTRLDRRYPISYSILSGFAILVAVFIVSNVTAANDYQKERQFQKLNKVADDRKRVTVWRGGVKTDIHQSEVLTGDVIQVFEGMEVWLASTNGLDPS